MITVTRRFTFAAAHRLVKGYEGICSSLHGHNYTLDITLSTPYSTLDKHGMILDFNAIRTAVTDGVLGKLDHATLVCSADKALIGFLRKNHQRYVTFENNPTAEVIAEWILNEVNKVLAEKFPSCRVLRVVLYETQNCSAEVTGEGS